MFPQPSVPSAWWELRGGSKGVINFPWIFLCNAKFSPFWALLEYIQALIHLACLQVFLVTLWVIVYRLYQVRWQGQSDWFKRSHWTHLGWWSTGSPKLELFQLSQHLQVTNCRLISPSVYFPWNMTLEYQMQLSEGSWDKNPRHSNFRRKIFFQAVCLSKRYTKVPEVVFATSL